MEYGSTMYLVRAIWEGHDTNAGIKVNGGLMTQKKTLRIHLHHIQFTEQVFLICFTIE